MWKKSGSLRGEFTFLVFLLLIWSEFLIVNSVASGGLNYDGVAPSSVGTVGRLVKKEERRPIVSTEYGSISAVDVGDGTGRHEYHIQFITLEPNSLFLPVLLHADMVFYVHTGSGRLSWTDGDEVERVKLRQGDVYRIKSGTLFYLHSGLEPERQRLRVVAIFANPDDDELQSPPIGPYSSISDLIRGFDKRVLQAAFQVPEEVIEEITSETDTPAIVHAEPTRKKKFWEGNALFINALLGMKRHYTRAAVENKKKKSEAFNFFDEDPDVKNCNGWSMTVTKHDLHALHGSHTSVFMVNLTKGSMMGPHWNPTAAEVSIVLEGEGMVRVVCSGTLMNRKCNNTRFRVEEGDVFTVPRFHPMAQTSFNTGSLVFMGFSTTTKKNHPQFLAGKASVLQTLDRHILEASLNVSNTTIDQLLAAQHESIILECTSCAEDEELLMEEEIEKERKEEEERKRQEEEAKRREEEEERRKREKEEERRRREEEAARRREEEEEKRREEEEAKRRKEEEEEARRREEEEEEAKRREEEEERRRREEEERKREEQEERQREEEQRRREEEEEQQREEKQKSREEEEEEERRDEEERRRRRQEAAETREREERRRRQEKSRRREEEERRRRRERGRGEEQETEEEAARREEEERVERQRQQEEAARRQREVRLKIKQREEGANSLRSMFEA